LKLLQIPKDIFILFGNILLFLKNYLLILLAILLALLPTIISYSPWWHSFFLSSSQILIIIGLFLNLFGAIKVYKSVIPGPVHYAKSGQDIDSHPVAKIDELNAKKGLGYIITGIIFQIISIIARLM
jgi:hypothetical protein